MKPEAGSPNFGVSLGCLFSRAIAEQATQLADLALSGGERAAILDALEESLSAILHRKLCRVLLLELNAARVRGELEGATSEARWDHFLERSSHQEFWDGLAGAYPTLAARTARMVANICAATLEFAQRFAADRARLDALAGVTLGALKKISFGAGDRHRGGRTVAILECETGRAVYKPRSMAVEIALAQFVARIERPHSIAVPEVLDRGEYGWSKFVAHRYAADEQELARYYEGIGHWLAVMRLLGGTDLHQENLIAHGPSPVIVDCETLFTPKVPAPPSSFGDASDEAIRLVTGTVLATGLLPSRGQGLGFRGVDNSGVGALPTQQPKITIPAIVDAGTDRARIGTKEVDAKIAQNHPAQRPSLAEHWPRVLAGFDDFTRYFVDLQAAGQLRARLAPFEDCRLRVVVRPSQVYAEIERMLWHPVSLHNEAEGRARARELLSQMAENYTPAPSDPHVIESEIADLLSGDLPYFSTIARDGVLEGSGGARFRAPGNLVDAALDNWARADLAAERIYARAALVSAYVGDGWMPSESRLWPKQPRAGDLDKRRRAQAARVMDELIATAIRGRDRTVSWIAPNLSVAGWSIQPLRAELYGGLCGMALIAGAYVREQHAGRADPVEGVESLFDDLMLTLRLFHDKQEEGRREGAMRRPIPPGGYLGLGSQVWTWLTLAELGLDGGEGVARASSVARGIPVAAAADELPDIMSGRAGAIPPLLALARRSGDEFFLRRARDIGDDLCATATRHNGYVWWACSRWPGGIGGFSHGVSGVGWAMTQLARATGDDRHGETAQAAFAFEDSLFDEEEQAWTDLRTLGGPKTASAWCHGSVGIGLARLAIDSELSSQATRLTLRRAIAATMRRGLGWNHCACHGDTGAWELFDRAILAGEAPQGVTRESLLAAIVTSLEDSGPVCGLFREAFAPGLLTGLGGVAYQLLRAHPDSGLPSILTLED